MKEYVIKMSKEGEVLSLFLITILLVLSYSYVTDEVQAAATADPTHTGKAMLANIMPYLWLMFIILSLTAAIITIMG